MLFNFLSKFFSKEPKSPAYRVIDIHNIPKSIGIGIWSEERHFTSEAIEEFDNFVYQIDHENERQTYWLQLNLIWLSRQHKQLKGNYQLVETKDFLILLPSSSIKLTAVMATFETAYVRILSTLPGITKPVKEGKLPVMLFENKEEYYRYVEQYYSEGEFSMSAGMCIFKPLIHFCMPYDDLDVLEPTIIHELTHAYTSHLPLPVWLSEGLATNIEHRFYNTFHTSSAFEQIEKHQQFWNDQTIEKFLSGQLFSEPGEGSQRSYELAMLITQSLAGDYDRFTQLINYANFEDAGNKAMLDIYGVSLNDYIEHFLIKS
ncbi:MAG: hypothetical protein HWE27_11135 [Gammaproteobacteria bacterium]|nr:hypothetical protein [Gammaproteobacteria bacterium]